MKQMKTANKINENTKKWKVNGVELSLRKRFFVCQDLWRRFCVKGVRRHFWAWRLFWDFKCWQHRPHDATRVVGLGAGKNRVRDTTVCKELCGTWRFSYSCALKTAHAICLTLLRPQKGYEVVEGVLCRCLRRYIFCAPRSSKAFDFKEF